MSDTNEAVLREFQRAVWSSPQPIPRGRGRGSAFNSLQNSPTVQFPMEISEEDSRQDVVSDSGVSVRSSNSFPSRPTSRAEDLPNFNVDLQRDLVPPFGQGRLFGKGAFAGVYLHKYQGKSCAVKFFELQYQYPLQDQEQQDMFTRELYRHCLVYHPNIVKLLGANSSPGNRCIITEYGGTCLYDYIHTKNDRVSYRSILKITRGVALGLVHLHYNDIVHRDLHPGNVVIAQDGHVKLLDVGIAKILEHTSSKDSQIKSGCPLGSFRYLAPEIFMGENINSKVDIFALGMIMLEMWTTQRPWEKFSDAAICYKITSGERPEIPRDMPTVFSELISACWQKVCNERPTAADIVRVCDEELEKNPSVNKS